MAVVKGLTSITATVLWICWAAIFTAGREAGRHDQRNYNKQKGCNDLIFHFQGYFIINGFLHQLFYKYNIVFEERQGFAGLCC